MLYLLTQHTSNSCIVPNILVKFFPGDEDDMELVLDDHPLSVALEISTPTAETRLPSP